MNRQSSTAAINALEDYIFDLLLLWNGKRGGLTDCAAVIVIQSA